MKDIILDKIHDLETEIIRQNIRNRKDYNAYINEIPLFRLKEIKQIVRQLEG
jgi:hypothetical protein